MLNNEYKVLYGEEYFENRFTGQDVKRELSYRQEYQRIKKYVQSGRVLDIGCGMGNFLHIFDEKWEKYGIEISEYAAKKSEETGIKIVDYNCESEYFDLIIFRGVIQHLDTPLVALQEAVRMLRKGGYIVFLATPNSNSIYYKFFDTLPMLDPPRNFIIPSDIMLRQILINFGMQIKQIIYPYIGSPYAEPVKDHLKFLGKCLGMNYKFAFWKNSMEIYAQKG